MPLALVAEQEEPRRLFTAEQPAEARRPVPQPTSPQVLAVMQAIATILAVRVVLLLAGAGSFILFLIAALMPGALQTVVAGLYAVTVLLPIVGLSLKKG